MFAVLLASYLSLNLILRWLGWPLFHGHGAYGWPPPDTVTLVAMSLACMVPVWGLPLLVAASLPASRDRHRVPRAVVALTIVGLAFVEADMGWFALSRRHLSVDDITLFMEGDWSRHIGLTGTDLIRFSVKALAHAVAVTAMALVASRVAVKRSARHTWAAPLITMLLGGCTFAATTGHLSANGDRQMRALLVQHPMRLAGIEAGYLGIVGRDDFTRELSAMYRAAEPANERTAPNPLITAMTEQSVPSNPSIVVIAIEGLNADLANEMASLRTLETRSLRALDHNSTGNATHYGLLGLTHGLPMFFYGPPHSTQSAYVDALVRAGYRAKRFGIDIGAFGRLENYTTNFALVYYAATHWPYVHSAGYRARQPEVDEAFDFTRLDLLRFRKEITNRYLNCLDEADAWLARLLAGIDLDRTIVVLTSDHGEELLEHGRLSHASGLFGGQIRVPMLISLPGGRPGTIDAPTSHSQLMPALLTAMGLLPAADSSAPSIESVAVVAHNAHTNRPREWALIDARHKVLFRSHRNGEVDVSAILDRQDQPIQDWSAVDRMLLGRSFSQLRWMMDMGTPTARTAGVSAAPEPKPTPSARPSR
jgi:hypothetical protein